MKNINTLFVLLFLFVAPTISAQSIDYNTGKGYVANGYDVVSYFESEAKEGNKKFTATHDGIKYKFVSEQNKELFLKSPEKYTPQYGGYCAYAIGTKAKKVSINPKAYEIRDNKLYLFYNAWGANTLELWLENPEKLKTQANANWQNIKYSK